MSAQTTEWEENDSRISSPLNRNETKRKFHFCIYRQLNLNHEHISAIFFLLPKANLTKGKRQQQKQPMNGRKTLVLSHSARNENLIQTFVFFYWDILCRGVGSAPKLEKILSFYLFSMHEVFPAFGWLDYIEYIAFKSPEKIGLYKWKVKSARIVKINALAHAVVSRNCCE